MRCLLFLAIVAAITVLSEASPVESEDILGIILHNNVQG